MNESTHISNPDVVLVGSGIMSATLGAMLKALQPELRVQLYEMTDELAQEASFGWHNAGTGHAGICELSYTPNYGPDGEVDIRKAIEIFHQFEHSKQFWGYAVRSGIIKDASSFINPVPHLSFVFGQEQVDFLHSRYKQMRAHHFFKEMEYTIDRNTIRDWAPLLVAGRHETPIAATRMMHGSDVNFGALARQLVEWLGRQEGCGYATGHRVTGLTKVADTWELKVHDAKTGQTFCNQARFVFLGAGGGTLPLLQQAGVSEGKGLGGFPIGGQWLVCDKPEIVAQHTAKVYGMSPGSAPTMAVPHLDTRIIDGRKALLFGPYAKWTTKFLHKKGKPTDLPFSIRPDNLFSLIKVGLHNIPLVRYLFQQGTQSMKARMGELQKFYPDASEADWKLIDAGIRVQAIKKQDGDAGIVHFGTEVLTTADRSLSALLGASPGASVSSNIILQVVRECFGDVLKTEAGHERMKAMIPSYDVDLTLPESAPLHDRLSREAFASLGIA